ncbi:MAG TPA: hypothetical protein VGN23_00680 [Verrucomicrobiae bacterium]|jgi:hypothetical protein
MLTKKSKKPISPKNDPWRSGTWEGARREQLLRWSKLPLREKMAAVEAMGELANRFKKMRQSSAVARKA